MFFSVARLRLSILSALIFAHSFAQAHENTLFTSSVSYCSPPESLLIQQFDIAYIEKNTSVVFNVSAASVLPDIRVSANIFLNVYGMQPINISLDLCSVLGGALCPLPTYNFTGSDSIRLPSSIDVASRIPAIAYKIPDLEAFAQLTLTDVNTGKVRACVQATLSNGWSTRQTAVGRSTGGLTLAALVSAVAQSHAVGSLAPVRFMDLFYLLQTIAASGLLGLNYPSVFRAFTINFSWALGLFIQSPESSMQRSINSLRAHTGGNVAGDDDGGNPISLVNRKLSPFNVPASLLSLGNGTASPLEDMQILAQVATVTEDSSNVLQAGIPIYANTAGVVTANAFMTVFLSWLIFVAIVLGALALGFAVVLALRRTSRSKETCDRIVMAYPSWARAWCLRASLASVFPILIFVFWQWTLKDSWVAILFSVFALLAISALILPSFYFLFRQTRGFKEEVSSRQLEPITAPYRTSRSYTGILFVVAILVKAAITAFGHTHGFLQAILILVTETLLLGSIIVLRPHHTRGADVLSVFLGIVRMICAGLLVAFATSLRLAPIPRVVIGCILTVIFSITVVVMFINILVNMGLFRLMKYALCFGRHREGRRLGSKSSSLDSLESGKKGLDEKNVDTSMTPASSYLFKRPANPSPTHTPTSTSLPSPLTAGSAVPSMFTHSTEDSTLGEMLPRRWSFQHSRPPSGSTSSAASPNGGAFSLFTGSPQTPSSTLGTPRQHRLSMSVEGHHIDETRP
ncbi:TRP-domain-containing protein [Cristinia sonorae]|uniref:TRP-domain-containing protein n=1 Tax=Cristinia sonorae TaxID=1940300 RepID=A0A8K0XKS4_9AGAR|nr:TRP-domain-containing protein [Cristinia sonorae]